MFVDPESTFGTPATQYPVAADAVRIINATVTSKNPSQAREDAFGTATMNGSISLKATVEWSAELYAYTPGTAATAPDWADLLVNCGLLQQTAAVADTAVSGSGATTTVIPITEGTGANFTAGVSCVTISGETRRIASINEAANPDEITLATPLSTAPADTTTVTSGITFSPHDGADADPDGATIWLGNNSHMWRLTGAFATTVGINGGGDGAIRLTISGRARAARLQYTGTLNGGIDNSTTSIVVANVDIVPDDVSASNPYYYTIDAGETDEEFVQVTAKNTGTNTLTVIRSSPSGSAHSHSSGALIEPYQPAGTYSGSPVPATGGHTYLADVLSEVETFGVEVDHGLILREDIHGAAYKVADYVQGLRNVTATAEAWSRYTPEMHRVRDAIQRTGIEWFNQQGEATGSIVAVECPSVFVEVPDFSFDDGEVRLSFSGQARGTTEDEVFIMLG
jgi:hypothetical protein